MSTRLVLTAAALVLCGAALARLPAPPPLDDAAKAKAAEAAAQTAWQAKVDAWQLCKAQDRAVANYRRTAGAKPVAAGVPVGTPIAGTPVATAASAVSPAACMDPGPFAYAPPEQKPLEASGAHSPAATATNPPSVRAPSADMAPAKPATAASKKP